MKTFSFSLESVLVLRRFRKVQAAGDLAQATRERLYREALLTEARVELLEIERQFQTLLNENVRSGDVLMWRQAMDHARIRADRRELAVRESSADEQKCRDLLMECQMNEEAVDNLKEKRRSEFVKELERADERACADFAAARMADNCLSLS